MRILRHEIPIDDQKHEMTIGRVVHVASRRTEVVEVWAQDRRPWGREFRVVGTGHEVPLGWRHVGTTLSFSGFLVWHLLEHDAKEDSA